MSLTLYYSPGACSLASHIALEEAELEYDLHKVDLRAREQKSPEYLALNPKGSTPALKTDEGVLSENSAILAYVASQSQGAKLAPLDDPFAFAQWQSFNMYLASSVHPTIGRALFAGLEGEVKADAQEAALIRLRLVEEKLFRGPWAAGERYTLSDGYLYVFERWATNAGWLTRDAFPRLSEHMQRVQQRPAVLRALEQEGQQTL